MTRIQAARIASLGQATSSLSGTVSGLSAPALPKGYPPLDSEVWAQFPKTLDSERIWTGSDFQAVTGEAPKYVLELTDNELSAIHKAISDFKESGLPISHISRDNFTLPKSLVEKLETVSEIVHSGRGFAVLRGLEPKRLSSEDDTIAFCGLASYIGNERHTSPHGMVLNHVRSAVNDPKPASLATGVQLNASKLTGGMKFHADRFYADILAMHTRTLGSPDSGAQYLASFETIYNTLRETSPETLQILAGTWTWPSILNPTAAPETGPVIFPTPEGRVLAQLIYTPFMAPGSLSAAQQGALDVVNAVAHATAVKLDRKEGDVLFFNNLALLHARDAFLPGDSRHMLRLALREQGKMWAKPVGFEDKFEKGFGVPVEDQIVPVEDFDAWGTTTAGEQNHG
ncbi:MAG: hypothetical protein M1814_006740 [Vezdaea aestivalis]|nr:MAG: hypothetical protein M1814_006740 [Vezdaea aestivalis]